MTCLLFYSCNSIDWLAGWAPDGGGEEAQRGEGRGPAQSLRGQPGHIPGRPAELAPQGKDSAFSLADERAFCILSGVWNFDLLMLLLQYISVYAQVKDVLGSERVNLEHKLVTVARDGENWVSTFDTPQGTKVGIDINAYLKLCCSFTHSSDFTIPHTSITIDGALESTGSHLSGLCDLGDHRERSEWSVARGQGTGACELPSRSLGHHRLPQ